MKRTAQPVSVSSLNAPPTKKVRRAPIAPTSASGKTTKANSAQSQAEVTGTSTADIYDAMLGEISDLLMAAQQAQSLGRLKMASTYQLLVHARLVGLGKRFDRFLAHGQSSIPKISAERSLSFPQISKSGTAAAGSSATAGDTEASSSAGATTASTNAATGSTPLNKKGDGTHVVKNAQETLAKILPTEIDLDNTMMEHLARAAMELHNRRTGRGMLHERTEAKKINIETTPGGGVAWADDEKERCMKAAKNFGPDSYDAIAFAVGTRNPAEVKAHLKNVSGREKIQRNLAIAGVKKDDSVVGAAKGDSKVGGDGLATPEKQKRGRGKKPPSKAMLTIPSAIFDAKKMVSGGL